MADQRDLARELLVRARDDELAAKALLRVGEVSDVPLNCAAEARRPQRSVALRRSNLRPRRGAGRRVWSDARGGLHAGEAVTVEPAGDGELRVRRAALAFDDAFGALTGAYPPRGSRLARRRGDRAVRRLLDADVLIGALDRRDAHHDSARRLLTGWRQQQDAVTIRAVNLSEVLIAPAGIDGCIVLVAFSPASSPVCEGR